MSSKLIAGRYEIVREIARGGMGVVHEAVHNVSKKRVALKILFPHIAKDEVSRQRFLREASAPAQIGHEGIVEVYDAGVDPTDGSLFVAMELLEGQTMRDLLASRRLSLGEAFDLFERILDALAAAHARHIVHRDLKPENVYLARKPSGAEVVKILDFGIARDLDTAQQSMTQTGIAMGTPHYMAPEQAMSARGVVATADVWAVGAMVYETLAGTVPFDGETSSAVIVHVCTQSPRPLADLSPSTPPALVALVERCLQKKPEDRPKDAGAMLAELRQIRAMLGIPPGAWLAGATGTGTALPTGSPTAPGSYPNLAPPTAPGGPATAPGAFAPAAPGAPAAGFGAAAPGGFGPPPSNPGFGAPPSHGGFGPPPTGAGGFGGPPGAYPTPAASPGYAQPASGGFGPPPQPAGFGTGPGAAPVLPKKGLGMLGFVIGGLLLGGCVVVGGIVYWVTRDDGAAVASLVGEAVAGADAGSAKPEEAANGTPIAAATGSRLTGRLETGDTQLQSGEFFDSFPLHIANGSSAHVVVHSTEFNPYLIVRTPSGKQFDNDDAAEGSSDAALDVTVNEEGDWVAIVTSHAPGEAGGYEVTIE